MKKILIILVFVFIGAYSFAQNEMANDTIAEVAKETEAFQDGPYIFIVDKELIERKIVDGEAVETKLDVDAFPTKFKPQSSVYKNVEKVAALSDIHGQYNLALEILKNNKIIDKNCDWNFGNGHFVIVGDVFDRGDMVTEMLWLIYKLEKQAEAAGGKVHYLLGNHEYMVLQGDDRYVNPKYLKTAHLLQKSHKDLYGPNTVLGRWLRAKPTILKINSDVFVHGGISREVLASNFKISKINKEMIDGLERVNDTLAAPGLVDLYYSNKGPIWYRGYFNDNLPDEEITELLKLMKSEHVVVGHCSNEEVVQLYDKRIFGVDSSIKNGEYGEILFINKDYYSKGTKDGEKKDFD